MNKRHIVLAIGLAATVWLALTVSDRDGEGEFTVSESLQNPRPASAGESKPAEKSSNTESVSRLVAREESPEMPLKSSAFEARSWDPPPPPPAPPAPPSPPPFPFTYVGKKFEDGGWEVFLNIGERIVLVRENELIEQNWRIDKIEPNSMTLTYLPLNQKQNLSILAANQ